jgi:F420-non-reducing hydrogenase iron-sulfur subunit
MDTKTHEVTENRRDPEIPANSTTTWQPRIVAFFCNWCTYTAADLAGVSRLKYAPNIRVIRLMCSGRVDPQFVLAAFADGADGVLLGGCHIGDCHYAEGNFKTLRRLELLRRLLRDLGIEDQRLRLELISAAEGDRVKTVVDEMVAELRKLGPLGIPQKRAEWDRELTPMPIGSGLHAAGPESAASSDVACLGEVGPGSPAPAATSGTIA